MKKGYRGNWLYILPKCFLRETIFVTPERNTPSEKGFTLKGKNLLPRGENSFLLE